MCDTVLWRGIVMAFFDWNFDGKKDIFDDLSFSSQNYNTVNSFSLDIDASK